MGEEQRICHSEVHRNEREKAEGPAVVHDPDFLGQLETIGSAQSDAITFAAQYGEAGCPTSVAQSTRCPVHHGSERIGLSEAGQGA